MVMVLRTTPPVVRVLDVVAEPVLAALPANPARLWWCPTGLLTFLPLHAAGHHGSGPRRTLLNRVICSYTPTLRALAEARTRPPAPAKVLAVGQPATPGLSPLPNALTEVRRLASRLPGTTLFNGDAATRAAVLTALPEHTYLHFAGHGGQNPHNSVVQNRAAVHLPSLVGCSVISHTHSRFGWLRRKSRFTRSSLVTSTFGFLRVCRRGMPRVRRIA